MVGHIIAVKVNEYLSNNLTKLKKRKQKKSRRRYRRKRSRAHYYRTLHFLRSKRNTEDLSSSLEEVDIKDMEWSPNDSGSVTNLPSEVIEWQKQDQIAYWKARAISLEFENRMLKTHLRNVYAKTIEEYAEELEFHESNMERVYGRTETFYGNSVQSQEKDPSYNDVLDNQVKSKQAESKERKEEMENIYGDKAEKILGMETAIQLNYERYKEKLNPKFWPNLPLKL